MLLKLEGRQVVQVPRGGERPEVLRLRRGAGGRHQQRAHQHEQNRRQDPLVVLHFFHDLSFQ